MPRGACLPPVEKLKKPHLTAGLPSVGGLAAIRSWVSHHHRLKAPATAREEPAVCVLCPLEEMDSNFPYAGAMNLVSLLLCKSGLRTGGRVASIGLAQPDVAGEAA